MSDSEGLSFGERLRRLRQAAGLTQEELAERAGLTRKGVGALERGDRQRPYPHTVRALAAALGLSSDELATLATAVPQRDAAGSTRPAGPTPALPAPLTDLIGREADVATITDLLGVGERLLTLTGPGGVGKTRLAIASGHCLHSAGARDVAFVPLAQLGDSALLADSIAHALGLREAAEKSPREVLIAALRDRRLLLILDNFEHLVDAAPVVAELLERSPGVSALVTSRSPLRIRGERELAIRPLALPDSAHAPRPEDLARIPSAQLFTLRARDVSPAFMLTEANATAVAGICRRLDGLPLAIELAAARIRMLSPQRLLAHLDPLLPMLAEGARDLPERQRTMEATVRWSYDLLDEPERELFRRVSVFAGEWTLDGAHAVHPATDVLGTLSGLVEKSLVVPDTSRNRYRMLEPIRQFASNELGERPDMPEIRDRHARHFLALAEEGAPGLYGQGQLYWLQRLDAEHDDLRAALSWVLGNGDHRTPQRTQQGLRMAAALSRYWYLRGHWSEGRGWIAEALAAADPGQPAARATALDGAGLIALFQNDYRQASRFLEDGLAIFRELGDENGMVAVLTKLGFLACFENDAARAEELRAAIAPMEPNLEDRSTIGYLRIFFGLTAVIRGEVAEAIELHRQALAIFRELSDLHGMVWSLTNLGLLEMVSGDMRETRAVLQENLVLAIRLGEPASIQYSLLGLATAASQMGHLARAAVLWGAAEAVRETAGMELSPLARAQTQYDLWVDRTRAAMGDSVFASMWDEGRSTPLDHLVQEQTVSQPSPV